MFYHLDRQYKLTDEDRRWNQFIEEITMRPIEELTPLQKTAVLSFWYDTEIHSGGHSGYFDVFPEIPPEALIEALNQLGLQSAIDNYHFALQATNEALSDEMVDEIIEKADDTYYDIEPRPIDVLQQFVEKNHEEILGS